MKRKFDDSVVSIQGNVEEKRLIIGGSFEKFLSQKISQIGDFCGRVFVSKNCAFFGCLLAIAISVLIRSTRDLGHDSAAVLETSKKMLHGGKYVQDFWENNLPLFFVFNMVPHFLVEFSQKFFPQFLVIHPVIAAEIVANLLGIIAIFSSAKILARSEFAKDRAFFNLIIITFACGFFLRTHTLQFNEFGTKSTYLLAFSLPYISYQLIAAQKLNRVDHLITGALAALLFCLKPHYGILVIVFELQKMFEKKSFLVAIRSAFCLRNYTTLLGMLLYLLLLFKCFPDFIEAVPAISAAYFNSNSYIEIFFMLKYDIAALLYFFSVSSPLLATTPEFRFLRKLFLATLAAALIITSESIAGLDQRFYFYSIALPCVAASLLVCFRHGFINIRRDGFWIAVILLMPQFDDTAFKILLNACCVWWAFVLLVYQRNKKSLLPQKFCDQDFWHRFFFLRGRRAWLWFTLLVSSLIFLSFIHNGAKFFWLLSCIFMLCFLRLNQQLQLQLFAKKEFSRLSVIVIFAVISFFLSANLEIFRGGNSQFKSPNYITEQMTKIIRTSLEKDENFLIMTPAINGIYPLTTYLGKENKMPFLSAWPVFYRSTEHVPTEYFIDIFLNLMASPENKFLFVEVPKLLDSLEVCYVGLIETFSHTPKFRQVFKNYVFSNVIVEKKTVKNEIAFFADEQANSQAAASEHQVIERIVEVYVRKK